MTPEERTNQLRRFADLCTPNTETGSLNYRKFATLIRNATLEEAAQKCESYPDWAHWGQTDNYVKANAGAQDCAAAIRNLKDKT